MSSNLEKDEQKDSCKLKIYTKREKRAPLFITDFSHGQVNINSPSELEFQCFKKDVNEQKTEYEGHRKLVASNGRLHYEGNCNVSSLRYFVGVRDKVSGKMKLYDCVIFRMKPKLQIVISNVQPKPMTYSERLNVLTENFGSKARKRALSQNQKYSIDASVIEKVTVDSFLLQLPRCTEDNLDYSINYLPPINRIASSVHDVFDMHYIISSEEDSFLNMEAQNILIAPLDKFTKKRFSFFKYVSVRFENVTAIKAKYLLYLNYLFVFQRLKYTDIRKKDPAPNIPNPCKKKMLENFTVVSRTNGGKSTRSCSSELKDKIVSYIFVLALLIDGFTVNLEEIAEDLSNVKVPKLINIAEALGCYISKKKIGTQLVRYAELKIPLNVPIPKYARSSLNKKI